MIDAAERVARRDGPGAVTVEAVIREAGISRGGLMYHFPSKLDLIRALVERDVEYLRTALIGGDEPSGATPPGTPDERLRVYVDECAPEPGERDYAALIAALAEDPRVAAPWVELQRELDQLDIDQSEPGDVAAIVARLALDGLWVSNLIDPDRFTSEQMDHIVAAMWPGSTTTERK